MTKIEVTPETLAALVNLIDLGVRAGGIQMVAPAALVLPLLERAQRELATDGEK